MAKHIPDKYNDMVADNKWLHRIANETAKTNALLEHLIDLYVEDNPRKEEVKQKSGEATNIYPH
jgi:hypothetical protein